MSGPDADANKHVFRMIQKLPFSYPGIDADVRRLGVLLNEVFELAELKFSGRLALLNLACGRADETGVLDCASGIVVPLQDGSNLYVIPRSATTSLVPSVVEVFGDGSQ